MSNSSIVTEIGHKTRNRYERLRLVILFLHILLFHVKISCLLLFSPLRQSRISHFSFVFMSISFKEYILSCILRFVFISCIHLRCLHVRGCEGVYVCCMFVSFLPVSIVMFRNKSLKFITNYSKISICCVLTIRLNLPCELAI